jgi:pimeloyl-ACP methyl ester carboxylesterase
MMTGFTVGAIAASIVTAPGPEGSLEGDWIDAGKGTPIAVIIPGSGPTTRDGNNSFGVKAAPYKLLGEALAKQGVSSIRVDKRGMFGSKPALADPNKVTIADYAADARAWAKVAKSKSATSCAWLIGHSEGGLVALAAGQRKGDICGVIALASPGRRLGDTLREQLRSNPANAPILDEAMAAIDSIEAGRDVDDAALSPPLRPLFYKPVQPFLRDLLSHDPAALAGSLAVPLLIVQPETDLQVTMADAKALAEGRPSTKLVVVPGANHVLKTAPADRAANLATYADPALPLAPGIAEAIAAFIKEKR